MKKITFLFLTLVLFLTACGSDESENKENAETKEDTQEEKQKPDESNTDEEQENSATKENQTEEAESEEEQAKIDTSMYEYTENIEVTDAVELNDHITLIVEMNPEPTPGTAFQHVLDGTYDFLQQEYVQQADTIGINVLQGGAKIAMFTTYPEEFEADEEKPMGNAVLNASEVEAMIDEVKQYAKAMELPVE
ncbi:hypothetical protein [Salimicrobium jeotgali]|uniref:hypothetical protein n=1 Tax=Salimicrobium jeotgali TaxID=1230341 RepID=UPI000C8403CF|nr:hypothetical protein [Salimicrobium jeotgali]